MSAIHQRLLKNVDIKHVTYTLVISNQVFYTIKFQLINFKTDFRIVKIC